MKIKKVEQRLTNLHDKNKYIVHIQILKQAVTYGLVLKNCIEPLKSNKKLG